VNCTLDREATPRIARLPGTARGGMQSSTSSCGDHHCGRLSLFEASPNRSSCSDLLFCVGTQMGGAACPVVGGSARQKRAPVGACRRVLTSATLVGSKGSSARAVGCGTSA
jgi:hypothetical protein